jgi:capsular exopolysaccharide synthesis family protein
LPPSLALERCRSIRTSLELLARQRPLRTVMVASAGPREGKSTVLLNLGWAFTEIGRRPIIVDSDLRRPVLHRVLPTGSLLGLADVLASEATWEQVGQRLDDRLWLLPAGSCEGVNPGGILNADNVHRLFDFLQDRGDVMLFDSAPLLAVSDNLLLASMVDGVILVVRAGHTQRRDLLRAKDQLDKVGAALLGVVLNEVSRRETRRFTARYAEYYEALALPLGGPAARPRTSWWQRRRSPAGKPSGGSA